MNTINQTNWRPAGMDTSFHVGFVYVIQVAGRTKIGKSGSVDDCLKAAKRWDHSAESLVYWPTVQPLEAEAKVHSGLSRFRVHETHEQFILPQNVTKALISLDDKEFNIWLQLDCNVESLLADWPRIKNENMRGYECLFFPDESSVASTLVFHPVKPAYGLIEQLFKQNRLGFRRAQSFVTTEPVLRDLITKLQVKNDVLMRILGISESKINWGQMIEDALSKQGSLNQSIIR